VQLKSKLQLLKKNLNNPGNRVEKQARKIIDEEDEESVLDDDTSIVDVDDAPELQ